MLNLLTVIFGLALFLSLGFAASWAAIFVAERVRSSHGRTLGSMAGTAAFFGSFAAIMFALIAISHKLPFLGTLLRAMFG